MQSEGGIKMTTEQKSVEEFQERNLKGDLKTQSGYDVQEVYGPGDVADLDYTRDIGNPGVFPFTRGTYPRMYREKLWVRGVPPGNVTYAVDKGVSSDHESDDMFDKGLVTSGIRMAGDFHNIATVDLDHPLVGYDVDSCLGASYSIWPYLHGSMQWWTRNMLVRSVTEDFVLELGHAIGPPDVCAYTLYIAVLDTLGYDYTQIRGNMVNDPLHAYIMGCAIYKQPLEVAYRVSLDAMEWATRNTPKFRPSNGGCGYDLRESGITTVQELGFRFGEYIEYTDELLRRGIKFEEWGYRPALAFSGEIDFFETICKLRAARRMYARIATQRYGADPKTLRCPPCNTNLAGSSMTHQQPIFNVVRATIEAVASVLGGVNGMEMTSYTEAMSASPVEAHAINRGIEALIAEEANIPLTADPLGGSYYVEWLTSKIERDASAYLQKILDMGGMTAAIKSGWANAEVEKESIERQKEIEEGRKIKVAVNAYQSLNDFHIPLPMMPADKGSISDPLSKRQKEVLEQYRRFKETRDISKVKPALEKLYQATKGSKNVIPAMIEAWKAYASIGEVFGVIRLGMGFPYDQFEMVNPPDFLALN
jgi:methylmalonyl-CoA mutase N-terminal domain/subunit